jgi:hypothetical protein
LDQEMVFGQLQVVLMFLQSEKVVSEDFPKKG